MSKMRESGLSAQNPSELATFGVAAIETLAHLRSSLAALFSALPGGCRRPVDLERTLRVDHATGWRLHKIASTSDPLSIGVHVPGRASMRRVLKAATARSMPKDIVTAVEGSYDAFERLIKQYAGDRTTFDSMISALAGDEAGRIDLAMRRDAFRASSHIWGVQTHASMRTYAVHPNADDPDLLDIATVYGTYDRRLLREGASGMASSTSIHQGPRSTLAGSVPEPIGDDPTGFIREFSHGAVGGPRVVGNSPGASSVEYEHVGIPSSLTTAFAHVVRRFARWYRTEDDAYADFADSTCSPAEVQFLYVLLHSDTFGRPSPTTALLNDLRMAGERGEPKGGNPRTCPAWRRLPMAEVGESMGRGAAALETPDLPRYRELVTWVLGRLGWDPEGFEVYRLRIPYPVMGTRPYMTFPLPERGSEASG